MKRLFLILVLALAAGAAGAQSRNPFDQEAPRSGEIAVSLFGPGAAAMPFEGDVDWSVDRGWSMGLGASYTHWFNRHIGLTAGLKVSYLNYAQQARGIASTTTGTLPYWNGSGYVQKVSTLSVLTPRVEETQVMVMAEPSVQLSLQARHLYLNAGVAFSAMLHSYASFAYSESRYRLVSVEGLAQDISSNPVLADIDESVSGTHKPSDVLYPAFFLLAGEAGWKFHFDERNMVSLGLFGRYAPVQRSTSQGDRTPLSLREARTKASAPMTTTLVDHLGYYEVGLRVAYHFGVGSVLNGKKSPATHDAK